MTFRNEITLRMVKRNERLAEEFPIDIADLELFVEYDYPDGAWEPPPGFEPRT